MSADLLRVLMLVAGGALACLFATSLLVAGLLMWRRHRRGQPPLP